MELSSIDGLYHKNWDYNLINFPNRLDYTVMLVVTDRRILACFCFLLAYHVSSLADPPVLAVSLVFEALPPEKD